MEHTTTEDYLCPACRPSGVAIIFLVCSLFFLCLSAPLQAYSDPCRKSTEGTDFIFGFMESRNYQPEHYLEITVTSDETTTFRITTGRDEIPYGGTYTVEANQAVQVAIPWQLVEATGSEEVQDKGIHLTSEKPVNVYALNWAQNSADVAIIYPTASLGKEYFAVCYQPAVDTNPTQSNGRNSEFLIVATENNTEVVITPSKVTDQGKPQSEPFAITLHRGEVYQVQSENVPGADGQGDLTGSHILADKPVAFYSGSLSTQVPVGWCCWDHLYEQIPPVQTWGREYYLAPLKSRQRDLYRIVAAHNHTTIQISGLNSVSLNRGEFYDFTAFSYDPKQVVADKPVLVAQYSMSRDIDSSFTGGDGDPFMIILSPSNQSRNEVTFVAYKSPDVEIENYTGITKYFVNIICPTDDTTYIRLNGDTIAEPFTPFPGGAYSYAQVSVDTGTHHLKNIREAGGFLAYVYGFGGVESYGYGVGFNLDLTLDLGKSFLFDGDTLLLCHGDTLRLDAAPWFDQYQWSTGETTQAIAVTEPGIYWVETTTLEGCGQTDSVYVFKSHPVTYIGDDLAACPPFSTLLEAKGDFESYLWQNTTGDTLTTDRNYQAQQTGDYRLTAFDRYGCAARDTMHLEIHPVPTLQIQAPGLVCESRRLHLTLTLSGTPEALADAGNDFRWGTDRPAELHVTAAAQQSATVEISTWGTFQVWYELTTVHGCRVGDTVSVRFHDLKPRFDFTADIVEGCQPLQTEITAVSEEPRLRFDWQIGTYPYSNQKALNVTITEPGSIDVMAIARSAESGCADTIFRPGWIEVYPKPAAGFRPDYTVAFVDESEITFTNESVGAINYAWTFGDGSVSDDTDPQHAYAAKGIYLVDLVVTSPMGCRDTAATEIIILPSDVPVPNAFAPESAIAINRTFMPVKLGIDPSGFLLQIYNRGGNLVFESKNPDQPWNGMMMSGDPAPMGTYVWQVSYRDLRGKTREQRGQVLLVR